MCRQDIQFKGMNAIADEWEDERVITRYDEIFEECIEEVMEDWEGIMSPMEIFAIVHSNYSKIVNDDLIYYEDDWVYLILSSLDIPFQPSSDKPMYYETKPQPKNFVSKYVTPRRFNLFNV